MSLSKSSYRVIKTQWGIAIDIIGEITSWDNYKEKVFCKKIDDGLWVRILNTLTYDEENFVYAGLKAISESINLASPYRFNSLIIFHAIEYNLCDYQPEGLIPAIYKWVSDTLKIDTPKIEARFNIASNKYEFNCYRKKD